MPFHVISGTYHLTNRSAAGAPSGFEPDGDSIHFRPAQPALLDRLTRLGRPYALTAIGSVMLRMEGIDALELHFSAPGLASTHQPRPLADQARDFLLAQLGFANVAFAPPRNVRVRPPVERDGLPGFIVSRALEVNGRPVSFAFAGTPPIPDGTEIVLEPPLLRQSLNYKSLLRGHAYPLFYDGLFVDLRHTLREAARRARTARLGLWAQDRSQTGMTVGSQADLKTDGVLFPKLFRRIVEFWADTNAPAAGPNLLAGFPAWLQATEERLLDVPRLNFTHFDNAVAVSPDDGATVRMTRAPEDLIFVSAR